jgi:hypothetical protein
MFLITIRPRDMTSDQVSWALCIREVNNNSLASVRELVVPTEVSADFLLIENVTWSARRIPTTVFLVF